MKTHDFFNSVFSAEETLGTELLKEIARELVIKVRESATIDFTLKESVQAKMRLEKRKLLRKVVKKF